MFLLNNSPIKFKDDELNFFATRYYDGTLAIVCETIQGEPYATISVNLSGYGCSLTDNQIVLNHDLSEKLRELVIKLFGESTKPIKYGYAESLILMLKPEIIEQVKKIG